MKGREGGFLYVRRSQLTRQGKIDGFIVLAV